MSKSPDTKIPDDERRRPISGYLLVLLASRPRPRMTFAASYTYTAPGSQKSVCLRNRETASVVRLKSRTLPQVRIRE